MDRNGIFISLVAQLDKLARHNRQGSYRTKERYYEAMKRFCRFLAEEFHLQKLANISGKHLTAYVLRMQAEEKAASTIKTELAAIRFFHDKIDRPRYKLPDNNELAVTLERRRFGEQDRTWSRGEYERFLSFCSEHGRPDFADLAQLTYHLGLRIHECFRIDTAMADAVLRDGVLTIKGKGGKVRTIPIEDPCVLELLRHWREQTPRGHKLFVPPGLPTDSSILAFQQFLIYARPSVQDRGSVRPMTHHGLRHTYAARKYQELTASGKSELEAHLEVSRLLGHNRAEVTDIYLASIDRDFL